MDNETAIMCAENFLAEPNEFEIEGPNYKIQILNRESEDPIIVDISSDGKWTHDIVDADDLVDTLSKLLMKHEASEIHANNTLAQALMTFYED